MSDSNEINALTIPSWSLLCKIVHGNSYPIKNSRAANSQDLFPFTSFLVDVCSATRTKSRGWLPSTSELWVGYSLFFVASALVRGGETLRKVIPFANCFDPYRPDQVIVQNVAPKSDVMLLVNDLKNQSAATILVLQDHFPAFDAILIVQGMVIGLQVKSKLLPQKAKEKIETSLAKMRTEGAKVGGINVDYIILYIGDGVPPHDLRIESNTAIVTAGDLQQHFLDAFFRYGLSDPNLMIPQDSQPQDS